MVLGDPSPTRRANTYLSVIFALGAVIAGIALILAASKSSWWAEGSIWQSLVGQLGGLLVVTASLTVLWDLKGRRAFADEVLAKAQVGADVRASGLERLSLLWLEDVAWADLFGRAREVEIFVSYGSSWRNVHYSRLDDYSKKSGRKMRVYLPDPEDESVMRVLAQRYDTSPEAMVQKVWEAAKAFANLRKGRGADIRVYFRSGDPAFACYRFDDYTVTTLYSHQRSRGEVPTFVAGPGPLTDFFKTELEAIRRQSHEVSKERLGGANA